MKKYLFIGNSSKPTKEKYESIEKISPSNVSRPCMEIAHEMGYNVYLGINKKYPEKIQTNMPFKVTLYDSHTYRSITNFKDNYIAYKNLMKLLSKEKIDVIHCNTPVGGLIGRICGKKKKVNKIIYTAHGFHFYKGAPLINNTLYKFAEKIMARWTDAIITMNQEDYEAAKKFKLKKGGKVYLTHGVGIDLTSFENKNINYIKKRKELSLSNKDFVLISIGDINNNKNISLLLEIIKNIDKKDIKCLICGRGPLTEKMKEKAKKMNISHQIQFLGFRSDIADLLKIADVYISTSKREGLPRALMEAMASGLPCVVSDVRGNRDLIDSEKGGFCCENVNSYCESIKKIMDDKKLRRELINYNLFKIKDFSYNKVEKELKEIYKDILL